jgi:hypothetical protein
MKKNTHKEVLKIMLGQMPYNKQKFKYLRTKKKYCLQLILLTIMNRMKYVGFEVLTAVGSIFWDIKPCGLLNSSVSKEHRFIIFWVDE